MKLFHPMQNLIVERRHEISKYLSEYILKDVADLISLYDYYLAGISTVIKSCVTLFDIFPDGLIVYYDRVTFEIKIFNPSKSSVCDLKTDNDMIVGKDDGINILTAHPCGYVISASIASNGTIKLWNILNKTCTELKGHTLGINYITVLSNSKHFIASASSDNTIKIWNIALTDPNNCSDSAGASDSASDSARASVSACICTIDNPAGGSVRCINSLSGGRLVCGSDNDIVRIWSFDDKGNSQCDHTIFPGTAVYNIFTLADGRIACELFSKINMWDLKGTGKYLRDKVINADQIISCSTMLPNGKIIIGLKNYIGLKNQIKIFSANIKSQTDIYVEEPNIIFDCDKPLICVKIYPDGRVVSVDEAGLLKMWC